MTVLIGDRKIRIPKPKLLTYDDYAKLTPPDNGNYELHKGQIIFMPTPIPKHQEISGKLHYLLFGYTLSHKNGKVYAAPMDTEFTPNDTLQPDILFISKERLSIIGEKKIEGAPDFIVEILSPSNTNKEMSYKKYIYESCGVKEYWVIYPEKKTVKQYESRDNEFVLIGEFGINDSVKASIIEGFTVKIADIFE